MIITPHYPADVSALVPATVLGHNLEMAGDTIQGLVSDRLCNSTFRGPANPETGVAPGWDLAPGRGVPGMHLAGIPGGGLNGSDAQMINNYAGHWNKGILQTGRAIRAGETLAVTCWARCQHHPVTIRVGLRATTSHLPEYTDADITVTTPYFADYQATLSVPVDDDNAVFFIYSQTEGEVVLDQIHLQPADAGRLRTELFDAWQSLRIPVLRFPGGCVSTGYHWRWGVQPPHLRQVQHDPVFKWDIHYAFGTEDYLALCHEQGIRPHITVNIGTGTPEDAGAWAVWCADWFRQRGIEPPVMYWQMGNEHSSTHELGHMSAAMYVDTLRDFVPAVRAGYPQARIIALGEEVGYGLRPGESAPWRQVVLADAADLVDLLNVHLYAFSEYHPDTEQRYLRHLQQAEQLAGVARNAVADCRSYGKTVAVTEWNLWTTATHYDGKGFYEPYDIEHALFTAGMFHHFFRLAPNLELTNFYELLNPMGIYRCYGATYQESLLADLFRLYRPALPGWVFPVAIDSPPLPNALAALDAIGLQTDDARWIFVVNRSLYEAYPIEMNALGEIETLQLLKGEDLAQQQFIQSQPDRGCEVELPPRSILRIRLHPAG